MDKMFPAEPITKCLLFTIEQVASGAGGAKNDKKEAEKKKPVIKMVLPGDQFSSRGGLLVYCVRVTKRVSLPAI
jgi:hypothetical protein